MSRRSPSPAVLLAVLLVLVCAAGCGGLPTPAGVRTVRAVAQDSQRDESTVREIPAGPFPQESALETARGFLAAGGDLDVLTRFLAPGTDWDPYAQQTVVYEGSLPAVRQPRSMAGSPTRLTTSLTLTGVLRIDPDGTTSPVSPSAPMTVAVGLVQSATGEWRVDAPPPVVLVRDTDLAQGHRRVGLGWLAPGGQTLVTEPVLLAVPEGALGPAIVTALLAGPPQRLRAVGV